MKETSCFNTPEKNTKKSDNKPLLPPPAKNANGSPGLYRPRGMGASSGFMGKYASAKALEYAVNLYFDKKLADEKPLTIAGLALSLGFTTKEALRRYEEKGEDFADVIDTARTRIEEWKNELLIEGGRNVNGIVFDLKNHHGYSDRIEQKTVVEAGDSLTQLLSALQGSVLRPVIASTAVQLEGNTDTEEAEYYPSDDDVSDFLLNEFEDKTFSNDDYDLEDLV
jgi:hypothetical protein